jgi:predicted transcriptional regulator of viral defense system
MTRSIPPSLAPVIEQLELEDARLVTTNQLAAILKQFEVRTAPRTVATRLRERGWLLETGERGVWEFAPGALAGAHSRSGPTRLLRAAIARRDVRCALTFQAAAWATGAADRVPSRLEVAAATAADARRLPEALDVSVFAPRVDPTEAKGVPVLRPASVLAHMAAAPSRVRSWSSALEWLPELAAEAELAEALAELHGRPATVAARLGYLLQGLRPDIAQRIEPLIYKTWFGPRGPLLRHDNRWLVADTILPFDPRTLPSSL